MGIKDLFHLPKYITRLEHNLASEIALNTSQQTAIVHLDQKVNDLEKELKLYEGKIQAIEKYFTSKPQKNEIEEKEIEEIVVDESYRIPIVDGIKLKYEGESDDKARLLNIQRGN